MKTAKYKTFLMQIESGRIVTDGQRVFNYIKNNKGCIERQIAIKLKMPIQTVSARVSGLKDFGIVCSDTQVEKPKGVHEALKVEVDPAKILKNQLQRKRDKFKSWIKRYERFKDFIPEDLQVEMENLKIYGNG